MWKNPPIPCVPEQTKQLLAKDILIIIWITYEGMSALRYEGGAEKKLKQWKK